MANDSARQLIVAANAPKPVGPYSPAILAGDYLFLSGQGARDAAGGMPEGIEAQARQCLENVKAIAEAAGLNLKHIVHLQLYLEDKENFGENLTMGHQGYGEITITVTYRRIEYNLQASAAHTRKLK